MNNTTKWLTETEYIDIETGEIISKSCFDRHYYIIKETETKTEYKQIKGQNYGIKKIKKLCERNRQQRIEFSV